MSQLDSEDLEQLLRLASLYLQIENLQKAREYIARARKYAHHKGIFETLADQIEILEQQTKNK